MSLLGLIRNRHRSAERDSPVTPPTRDGRSRRAVLAGAFGGAAAAAAGALAKPASVLAATDDGKIIHVGDSFQNVTTVTYLENSTTPIAVLYARHYAGGTAVAGDSYNGSEPAVRGQGPIGVQGAGGTGVYGLSVVANGRGVVGEAGHGSTEIYGVFGTANSGLGRAVFGWSTATQNGTGVWGQSDGALGAAVRGYAWDGVDGSGNYGTGVIGTSGSHAFPPPAPLANTGVYGIGIGGRGGVFKGTAAQLKLVPSTASHPSSGQAGDFFVDKSNSLWFCKGATNWVKLA